MKLTIDSKACIGCMLCKNIAEEVFEMKEEKGEIKAKVKKSIDFDKKENQDKAKEAVESCPVEAIKVL